MTFDDPDEEEGGRGAPEEEGWRGKRWDNFRGRGKTGGRKLKRGGVTIWKLKRSEEKRLKLVVHVWGERLKSERPCLETMMISCEIVTTTRASSLIKIIGCVARASDHFILMRY